MQTRTRQRSRMNYVVDRFLNGKQRIEAIGLARYLSYPSQHSEVPRAELARVCGPSLDRDKREVGGKVPEDALRDEGTVPIVVRSSFAVKKFRLDLGKEHVNPGDTSYKAGPELGRYECSS